MEQIKILNKGNIILVTGSNKGIGFGIVESLLSKKDQEYKVILTYRREDLGQASVDKLLSQFPEAKDRLFSHQLEVTSAESIENLGKWIAEKFGKIDVLVNNAGTASKGNAFNYDSFIAVFDTNVFGTINLTESLLQKDLINQNGKIVILGSTVGNLCRLGKDELKELFRNPGLNVNGLLNIARRFGNAIKGNTVETEGWNKNIYSVSKMIINTYASVLGKRQDVVDKNIGVYACCPGWVKTDLAGPNAILTIEEGAVTPTYLAELPPTINNDLQGKFFFNCKPVSFDS
jgi:NAD(P)-dependent dehydrogenase (short-subunit alcohol dehydrogenase family)